MILVTSYHQFPDDQYEIPQEVRDDGPEAIIEWYEQFGDLGDYEISRNIYFS